MGRGLIIGTPRSRVMIMAEMVLVWEPRFKPRSMACLTLRSPVINMAEEMQLVWKQVSMRKEPSFFAVPFSGSELQEGRRTV